MTDTTATPTPTPTPRATVCDVDGCHTLIPATLEDRREHRRGHAHDRKVIEALRAQLKDANTLIRRLASRLDDLEHEVGQIEIPDPVDPFAIVPANDLDPLDDDDDDEQDHDFATDDQEEQVEDDEEQTAQAVVVNNYFNDNPGIR